MLVRFSGSRTNVVGKLMKLCVQAKWLCSKGHSWEALVSNRSQRGDPCPQCNGSALQLEAQRVLEQIKKSHLPSLTWMVSFFLGLRVSDSCE